MAINLYSLANAVKAGLRILRATGKGAGAVPQTGRPARGPSIPAKDQGGQPPAGSYQDTQYPGDYRGRFSLRYAPQPDGEPDPGEVVWAWVPYEEDSTRGKDRPVLVVGRNGGYLLGLMLTSKDRVPASAVSRDYLDLGVGAWDRQGRPSEARLDRILQLRPDSIRREGSVLDRERFETVAAGLRWRHGWS
ncbi:PemK-like, MazF-like toxin of type II toxin-antitoxin system [Arthrobacter sp. SLBN-100]|uniref:type II toxin-antitoxin system PemK/MazF family toxin n=1 Tax=Arthrobacter sp. SLBN-100 TaxID=2768450 RepID=UPI00114EF57B|nr:type II toxin-antitoxin system PemK/MazF family toxin [Arthrobacter sp. SLBN-100]TQJ66686.1 PemK-like, MazF-like toxin of type II toxin-antitoxin system [Arthrobacter sp. SLBN-100]